MPKQNSGNKALTKKKFNLSILQLSILIGIFAFIVIYLGFSIYFKNHFLYGSEINNINVSCKTIDEANQLLHNSTEKYELTIKEVPKTLNENEQSFKNLFYLNMTWFMPTLLDRKDRMTMRASLEARVPFADTKLIEYLWNVPWEYKFHNNKEKGLLRDAFKDLLPESIYNRKKRPYTIVQGLGIMMQNAIFGT